MDLPLEDDDSTELLVGKETIGKAARFILLNLTSQFLHSIGDLWSFSVCWVAYRAVTYLLELALLWLQDDNDEDSVHCWFMFRTIV